MEILFLNKDTFWLESTIFQLVKSDRSWRTKTSKPHRLFGMTRACQERGNKVHKTKWFCHLSKISMLQLSGTCPYSPSKVKLLYSAFQTPRDIHNTYWAPLDFGGSTYLIYCTFFFLLHLSNGINFCCRQSRNTFYNT